MRIPHHLIRSSSGHCSFRQRVPIDLQSVLGRKVIKHTLHTKELPSARLRALMLASGYAQAFDVLRDRRVDRLCKKDMSWNRDQAPQRHTDRSGALVSALAR
ncbi:DUF6538 domain-containing protein [Pseudoxanthomonas sp. JBR18]|uniref:DUF6538 domain-containing protein n=1 Tax=Pseudoxanthomonas sp. JBR18 TaxID=2969308 RepID=UPI002FE33DEF